LTVSGSLLLRVDAWPQMGTGHVMRCLAMASAWRAAGRDAVFVSHGTIAGLRTRMAECGRLIALDSPAASPAEAQPLLAKLADEARAQQGQSSWLLLDGYHFDASWQPLARQLGLRLLVIDDHAAWSSYEADLVLNQNHGAEHLDYTCAESANLLLGSRWVLLRPEFGRWASWRRDVAATARRVLITLGGSDPAGAASLALDALRNIRADGLQVRLVVGPGSAAAQSLQRQAAELPASVQILTDVADMAGQMAWADVAVSAAGTTCWELAFMQLPSLLVVVADNQRRAAQNTSQSGAAENLGPVEQLSPDRLAESLHQLMHDGPRRASMAQAGRQLVDGRGAERVASVMQAFDQLPHDRILLRPTRQDDFLPLWRLANQPSVRRNSLHTAPIPLEDHQAWFASRWQSPDTRIWVMEFEGLLLGQVRYQRVDLQMAEISYSVAPAFRRRGLGTRLIAGTWRQTAADMGLRWLRAVVREENEASASTFRKLGFEDRGQRTVLGSPCRMFQREVTP